VARQIDVLIVDTSGRMHTQHNLMAELQKILRALGKVLSDAPHETLLVLDSTSGQNGLSQARAFLDRVPITGAILAKLDSSARGGMGLAVYRQLGIPIRYVGLGEGIDTLAHFDPQAYILGLTADAQARI
jgi:fused signal recognition particle receptor